MRFVNVTVQYQSCQNRVIDLAAKSGKVKILKMYILAKYL